MFLFRTHKLLLKLPCKKLFRVKNTSTFSFVTRKYSLHKQNIAEIVSFEDLRLQKYLQYLNELHTTANGNRNNLNTNIGFSYEMLNHIQLILKEIGDTKSEIQELDTLISDIKDKEDELYIAALSEKEHFQDKLNALQHNVLELIVPNEIADEKDIIMEITPGVGGQEAMLFAKDMFEMYCRYAQFKGWPHEILKYDTTDLGGVRVAHIGINGWNAFKILKYECGVHRVQRVPKTEKSGRIHTSTMTVAVLPQPSEIDIVIKPSDIELEFKRSSGAGGQHVNTTDSCVRIYHKPSGIVTESQVERDQHKNRQIAMKTLRAKLYERELMAIQKETTSARKSQVGTAARSEKVRTYNFAQDRITDHRAHITLHGVLDFLSGEDHFDRMSEMLQQWNNVQSLLEILNKFDST